MSKKETIEITQEEKDVIAAQAASKEVTVIKEETKQIVAKPEAPRGYDEDDSEDVIIPRIKVVQDLSPERKDKTAEAGDFVNSLTKEIINGKKYVPVFKYSNNIKWRDRSLGGGIECISKDGKTGNCSDGTSKQCLECGQNKFDNKQKGKDAVPLCTAYFNFFGFIEGEHIPLILSFAKTYYGEGKKMYSMLKFSFKDMWKTKFTIKSKLQSKNDNSWYIIQATGAGATSDEDVAFAEELFDMFRGTDIKADLDEANTNEEGSGNTMEVDKDIANEID